MATPRPQSRLRELRADRKSARRLLGSMSRRALARRAGLHQSYVSLILLGQRRPSLDASAAMAKALGITLDQFRARLTSITGGKVAKREVKEEIGSRP